MDKATDEDQYLEVGDDWTVGISAISNLTVSVSATSPTGVTTTPEVETPVDGLYTSTITLNEAGRWSAVVVATGDENGVEYFTAFAVELTEESGEVTVAECLAYLGGAEATSTSTDEIADALAAEDAAQRARCDVPAVYPVDLRQALKRRVARNLAARTVPVASFTSFEGGTTSKRVPLTDPEVARLEGPYRKRLMG